MTENLETNDGENSSLNWELIEASLTKTLQDVRFFRSMQRSFTQMKRDAKAASIKRERRCRRKFADYVLGDKGKVTCILHSLIDGRKSKDACIYIASAAQMGVIHLPTYNDFMQEFGLTSKKRVFILPPTIFN